MKKLVICSLLLGMMMTSIAGCGNKEQDIIADYQNINIVNNNENEETDTENSSNTNSNTTTTSESIPSHYETTFLGVLKNFMVTVDADVISEGYPSTSVYTVNIKDVDEAYLKDLATKIFDDGVYNVVAPYILMEPENIIVTNEKFGNTVDFEKYVATQYLKKNKSTDTFDESNLFYEYDAEGFGNRYMYYPLDVKSDHQTWARIEGKIDGKSYELCYMKSDLESVPRVYIHNQENGMSGSSVFDMDDPCYSGIYGDNRCDFDEATKWAEEIMSKLNNDNYKLAKTYERLGASNGETGNLEQFLDGYRFLYAPLIDNIQCQPYSNYDTLIVYQKEENKISQPSLIIDVTSAGIDCIKIMTDYEITSQSPIEGGLLSFDEINDKITEYVETKDDVDAAKMECYKISYKYVLVKDEGVYKYVPAWIYNYMRTGGTNDTEVDAYEKEWIGVNAIDGTIIRFNDSSSLAYYVYY